MPGPLEGVTVIDFTEYVAGPYGSMMLADMGAEVIKVEPLEGDHWRRHQPVAPAESRYFFGVNRGKKSVAIDAENADGRAVVDDLLRIADVVFLNYRQATIDRLRLDYDSVRMVNPSVIYCSITAFGRQGPYSSRPGFDLLVQAMTGIMDFEHKVERGVPIGITTFAPADTSSGMFAAFAIAAALYRRTQTGEGECIDLSLYASALAIQYRPTLSLERFDRQARETMLHAIDAVREGGASYEDILALRSGMGLHRAAALYYRVYRTADGMVAIACLNNRQRRRVRDEVGAQDPAVDGSAFTPPTEVDPAHHEALISRFEAAFLSRTTDQWLARWEELDVPAVPVVLTEEVFNSEQAAATNRFHRMQHPIVGEIVQPRTPVEMRNTSTGAEWPAPPLGAHVDEVLGRAGYSRERIESLLEKGIIRHPPTG